MLKFLKSRSFILLTVLALFVLAYHFTPLKRPISALNSPINSIGIKFYQTGLALKNHFAAIFNSTELFQSNQLQSEEIARLSLLNSRLLSLKEENENLKKLLDFVNSAEIKTVSAPVISFRQIFEKKILLIGAGSNQGAAEDFPVITQEGIIIGKILQLSQNSSQVMLLADSESAVASTIAGKSDIQGISRGLGGIGINLELIPQEANLETGDLVVTSLLENNTPAGLLIGKVGTLEYKEGELFKKASIEPIVQLSNLKNVSIILP